MDAKNMNLLASEDITVLAALLTLSKGIFGMRTLIRITVHGKDVSVPGYPQVQWRNREAKTTSECMTRLIRITVVYRAMIRQLSGGLECFTKLFD